MSFWACLLFSFTRQDKTNFEIVPDTIHLKSLHFPVLFPLPSLSDYDLPYWHLPDDRIPFPSQRIERNDIHGTRLSMTHCVTWNRSPDFVSTITRQDFQSRVFEHSYAIEIEYQVILQVSMFRDPIACSHRPARPSPYPRTRTCRFVKTDKPDRWLSSWFHTKSFHSPWSHPHPRRLHSSFCDRCWKLHLRQRIPSDDQSLSPHLLLSMCWHESFDDFYCISKSRLIINLNLQREILLLD